MLLDVREEFCSCSVSLPIIYKFSDLNFPCVYLEDLFGKKCQSVAEHRLAAYFVSLKSNTGNFIINGLSSETPAVVSLACNDSLALRALSAITA